MRQLALVRHAKSSWENPALDDFDRPLNKRGNRNAPFMGRKLKELGIHFDVIVSSPAVRALATARMIATEIGYSEERIQTDERIYEASRHRLLDVVNDIDEAHSCAALVGHNPGISDFAAVLARNGPGDMPTCAVVLLEFEVSVWSEVGPAMATLRAYEYPKKYKS
jgi:phosphohistidine phosphatase